MLARPVQAALPRIVREAATNAVKHAKASAVSVKLAYMANAGAERSWTMALGPTRGSKLGTLPTMTVPA